MPNAVTDKKVISKVGKNNFIQMGLAIEEADILALSYIKDTKMLNVASAIPFHQTIVNFAIDLVLERKCDEGLIKYNYRYEYNKARNCKHIELIKNDMLITHCSGNNSDFPRRAKYRERLCTNQLSLFEETNSDVMYCILMHSSQLQLGHKPIIAIGVPDSTCNKWCNYIPLNSLSGIVPLDVKQTEPDIEKFHFAMKERLKKSEIG